MPQLLELLPLLLLLLSGWQQPAQSACNNSVIILEIKETTPAGFNISAIDSTYQNSLFGTPQYVCYFELSDGYLRLARTFDLENFTSCSDGSTISKSSVPTAVTVTIQCASSSFMATFLIRLVDVNEFAPMFVPDFYTVNVSEAAGVNSQITQLNTHVIDLDKSNQQTFNFQIVNGSLGSFNIIDGITSGIIRLQRTLDFDAGPRQYVMSVAAAELPTEAASQPMALTGYATLVVNVLDFDDQNPAFSQNSYSLYFMENNTDYVNTSLTTSPPLLAYDLDVGINQTINYAIVSGYWWTATVPVTLVMGSQIDNASFLTINTTTGQFRVVSLIDRESLPASQLFVLVKSYQTDKPDTRVALTLVLVMVGDKNDNSPIMSAIAYSAAIVESSPAGSFVIGVTASDRDLGDNATVNYHLSDPSGAFQIDAASGHVTVANASLLDREITPEFNVTVWSQETSTPERYASPPSSLNIRLIDVNDNSPVFLNASGYSVTMDRSNATPSAALITLVATDADAGENGQITYSLIFVSVPGAQSLFSLDSGSGLLSAAAGLSTAPLDQYHLFVMAEDRADPPSNRRRSIVSVTVTLMSSTTTSTTSSATTTPAAVTTTATTTAYAATTTAETTTTSSATTTAPATTTTTTAAATTMSSSSSSSSSPAPTTTTRAETSNPTTPTTIASTAASPTTLPVTSTTMATTTVPSEVWNASMAVASIWIINSSHVLVELRTTHRGSRGNQTVTLETIALPVNASLVSQLTTMPTSAATSAATNSKSESPAANSTTTTARPDTTTTVQQVPTLPQPPPLGLIVACALLSLAAATLALVLGWFCFERSRLRAVTSSQAATIESLQQKTNPIFSNGQHPTQGEIGPDSADGPDTVDASEMGVRRSLADITNVSEAGAAAKVDAAMPKPTVQQPIRIGVDLSSHVPAIYQLFDDSFAATAEQMRMEQAVSEGARHPKYRLLPAFVTLRTKL